MPVRHRIFDMQFCLSTFHFSLEEAQSVFSFEFRGNDDECHSGTHVVAEGIAPALPASPAIPLNPLPRAGFVLMNHALSWKLVGVYSISSISFPSGSLIQHCFELSMPTVMGVTATPLATRPWR